MLIEKIKSLLDDNAIEYVSIERNPDIWWPPIKLSFKKYFLYIGLNDEKLNSRIEDEEHNKNFPESIITEENINDLFPQINFPGLSYIVIRSSWSKFITNLKFIEDFVRVNESN